MEYQVLSVAPGNADSYPALLRLYTISAADRASRIIAVYNPVSTIVTGEYLAFTVSAKLDLDACLKEIKLAGRYQADPASPEASIFGCMRSYPGRDRIGELVHCEKTHLNYLFKKFLDMYLQGAEYNLEVEPGLDSRGRWLRFGFSYKDHQFRVLFQNFNDGTERIHLHALDHNFQTTQRFDISAGTLAHYVDQLIK